MDINELKEIINNINNQSDINSISDNIVKHFAEISNIDLDDYVYKDNETQAEQVGGESNE